MPLAPLPSSVVDSACPGSPAPTLVDNKKLYFHSTEVSWNDAQTLCPSGTVLAQFLNYKEFNVIRSKAGGAFAPFHHNLQISTR